MNADETPIAVIGLTHVDAVAVDAVAVDAVAVDAVAQQQQQQQHQQQRLQAALQLELFIVIFFDMILLIFVLNKKGRVPVFADKYVYTIKKQLMFSSGYSSVVEHLVANENVARSNRVTRLMRNYSTSV